VVFLLIEFPLRQQKSLCQFTFRCALIFVDTYAHTLLLEINSIFHLCSEIGIRLSQPPTLWCDNIGASYLTSNPVFHARTKHVEIDFHFVRDVVAKKSLFIKSICSKDQLANIFTKLLPSSRFNLLRSKLNVTTVPFSLRGRVSDKVHSNTKTQDSIGLLAAQLQIKINRVHLIFKSYT
jgi:hypothetical protein